MYFPTIYPSWCYLDFYICPNSMMGDSCTDLYAAVILYLNLVVLQQKLQKIQPCFSRHLISQQELFDGRSYRPLTSFFAVSCEASALIFLFEFSFTPLNGLYLRQSIFHSYRILDFIKHIYIIFRITYTRNLINFNIIVFTYHL